MWHRQTIGRLGSWSRRRFNGALLRLPAALLAATALSPRTARATALSDHTAATLDRIAYLLFPFPELGGGAYRRVTESILATATRATSQMIADGIATLDGDGPRWLERADAEQLSALRAAESGAFFQFMLQTTKIQLFNDREVWAHIGYGGSSLEHGGYVSRGLNDVHWFESD